MSANKGGALVRSPPGVVDTYNNHVGTSSSWGDQSTSHITTHKHQQPKRNASVTKISSGGYKDSISNNNKNVKGVAGKTDEISQLKEEDEEDIEKECNCGGWAKARQVEYDLEQLQKTHNEILYGLHNQLDDMKQKNRDLTFQLLMGPYANSVQEGVPLSPESDLTPPKEGKKMARYEAIPENRESSEQIIVEMKKDAPAKEIPNELSSEQIKLVNGQRLMRDPRLTRSLDVELLEEESESLKKQLFEERAKNKYLLNLAEDLKRQIREETGSWCPPPPISKIAGHKIQQKHMYSNSTNQHSYDVGSSHSFRLPQIPYSEQRVQSSHEQIQENDHNTNVFTNGSKRKNNAIKYSERNKEFGAAKALPSIPASGNLHFKISNQLRSNEARIDLTNSDTGRHNSKNKNHGISQVLNVTQGGNGQISQHISFEQTNQPLEDGYKRTRNLLKNEDVIYHSKPHENHQQCINNDQERKKEPHRIRETPLKNKGNRSQSPNNRTQKGESSLKSKNSSRRKGTELDKNFQLADDETYSHASKSKDTHLQLKREVEFIPSQNYKNEDEKKALYKLSESKQHSLKKNRVYDQGQSNSEISPIASSSSSIGSLVSTASRNKHRGKNYKRGGKKNKKDSPEIREERQ